MTRKTLHSSVAAAFIALAALGCSSDSGTDGGGTVACTGSVSGAVTGTYTCTVTAVWATAGNLGAVEISTVGSPTLTVALGFTGAPTAKTYLSTDAGAVSGASISSGTAAWLVSAGGGTNQGTYSLNLTSVGTAVTTANGNSYTVHGTFTATLPPASGSTATGNATVSITF